MEQYLFTARDRPILHAAARLLVKITKAPFTRPEELILIAQALHTFSRLPEVTPMESSLSISLKGPTRRFGEHEIWHSWNIGIEDTNVCIDTGGHFYRKSSGGDAFTCIQWSAWPGSEADFNDYSHLHRIVDDLQPFSQEVDNLDLSEAGFSLNIYLDGESLYEEIEDEEEDDEDDEGVDEDEAEPPITSFILTVAEEGLLKFYDGEKGFKQGITIDNGPPKCDLCGCDLTKRAFFIDGRLRGDLMGANMCAECFLKRGEGIAPGDGQLFQHQPGGEWLMVGGFSPDEPEDVEQYEE